MLAALIPSIAAAQGIAELRGNVTDAAGSVVPGAMVRLSGTRYASLVDSTGRYRVSAAPGTTLPAASVTFPRSSAVPCAAAIEGMRAASIDMHRTLRVTINLAD